jgi:hypothetical protein
MAVVVNNWTTGKPMATNGSTGVQSVKHIPAARAFIKASDSILAAPVNSYAAYSFKTNGVAPVGWTDLGTTSGNGKVTYTKSMKKVQTGLDNVTRLVYINDKSAQLQIDLTQLDDYLLTQLGFNASVITSGSTVNFQIGQEDVVEKALLLVYANKLDGKEIHWYHPSAKMAVTFQENGDEVGVRVDCELTAFTASGATVDSLVSVTVFA